MRLTTRDEWRIATLDRLAEGYATNNDRRTAALIRQRQRDRVETTDAQRDFADRVEEIVANENSRR